MSLSSLPPFFSAILFFGLGLFVFLTKPKSSVNRAYAVWAAFTVWWQASWAFLFNITDPAVAAVVVRVGYSGIIFLPMAFLHFAVEFLGFMEKRRWVLVSYAAGVFFLVLLWTTDSFIAGVYSYSWGFYPKAGPLHPVYLVLLSGLVAQSLFWAFRQKGKSVNSPLRFNQIKHVLLGNWLYVPAATDFLVNYGVDFYPLGFIAVLASLGTMSYAIYKYSLMDFTLTFRHALVYFLFGCLLSFPLFFLVHFVKSWWLSSALMVATIFFSPLLFVKLRDKLTAAVDSLPPFKGKYDRLNHLQEQKDQIALAGGLEEWARLLMSAAEKLFGPQGGSVLVLDEEMGMLRPLASTAPASSGIEVNGLFARRLEEKKLLAREPSSPEGALPGEFDGELEKREAQLAFPLFAKGRLAAVLFLGQKADGRMYNELDVSAAWGLVNAAEMTLTALLTSSELVRKERLAVMGEVAAITGHELRNALVAISHSAFVLENRVADPALQKHIGIINSQIAASNKTLGDILSYVRNRAPALAPCRLEELLAVVLDALKLAEGVQLKVEFPASLPAVSADRDEMKQVLVNLLNNAVDAMPQGGTLAVTAAADGPAVEVRVSDTGCGISKERMGKLFTPLFSTKRHGTGLGLLMVKRTVERHKGAIAVESVENDGTTVRVRLPIISNGA